MSKPKFEEIKEPVLSFLQSLDGKFTTSYRICKILEDHHPSLWKRLKEYHHSVGKGAGAHYTPANFVPSALDHFVRMGEPGLRKEYLEITHSTFEGVEPGYQGKNGITIWAWREN